MFSVLLGSTIIAEQEHYRLTTSSTKYASGTAISIEIKSLNEVKINTKAPLSLALTLNAETIQYAKDRFKIEDEHTASLTLELPATKQKQIEGTLKFVLCTSKWCKPVTRELVFKLPHKNEPKSSPTKSF